MYFFFLKTDRNSVLGKETQARFKFEWGNSGCEGEGGGGGGGGRGGKGGMKNIKPYYNHVNYSFLIQKKTLLSRREMNHTAEHLVLLS